MRAVKQLKTCLNEDKLNLTEFQSINIPENLILEWNQKSEQNGEENEDIDNIVETAWLKYQPVISLTDAITDVTESCEKGHCWFKMKTTDSKKLNMDCLDVFEHRSDQEYLYGVYHTFDKGLGDFVTYLARAKKEFWRLEDRDRT